MSAFMVPTETMNDAVRGVMLVTHGLFDPTALGVRLYQLNRKAMHERYGRWDKAPDFAFQGPQPADDEAEHARIVKAMHCLHYQCSEGDCVADPIYTGLEGVLRAVERRFVERYYPDHRNDEGGFDFFDISAAYRDAPWG